MEQVVKKFEKRDSDIERLIGLQKTVGLTKLQKRDIEQEIRNIRAGDAAEKRASHLLRERVKLNPDTFLINGLRLESGEDVCQIDHVTLNRLGIVTLYETKSVNTGIKITDDGSFLRWDKYKRRYEEFPSPIKQSERHEYLLKKYLKKIGFPVVEIRHIVLVDYKANLQKPKKGFECVCRPDRIDDALSAMAEKKSVLNVLGSAGKMLFNKMSRAECFVMAQALASCHKPITINFAAKFGIDVKEESPAPAESKEIAKKAPASEGVKQNEKLTTGKMAAKLGLKTKEFEAKLVGSGYLYDNGGSLHLTDFAKEQGIEFARGRYGYYFLFPAGFSL